MLYETANINYLNKHSKVILFRLYNIIFKVHDSNEQWYEEMGANVSFN